ncbi:MAG: FAD/NAD(P)-binding protein [Cyanobacteria bacterium REEB67]|nr:FAD/NAD(P)-binding protein [Cyanobacteria bacterium REEB67]
MNDKPTRIAIIGGGFSGAMTALHLLRNTKQNLSITIFEPRPVIGRGLAYSTVCDGHLLNVPAGGMSAYADDPGHFLRYATTRDATADERTFVPRMIFGDYITGMVREAIEQGNSNSSVKHVTETVLDVRKKDTGFEIEVSGKKTFEADQVILALGNMGGRKPRWLQNVPAIADHYLHDPWQPGAIESIGLDEDILLIGTGLTAVDKMIELEVKGHRGKIYAASRHGLLPRPHVARYVGLKNQAEIVPGNALKAFKSLRAQVVSNEAAGGDQDSWRLVFDGMRAETQNWWQSLSLAEQKRFLRHLRTYYDVHRHRMAPHIGEIVDSLAKSEQLRVLAARMESVEADNGRFKVTLKNRHNGQTVILTVDRMINCTGPQANIDAIESPLLRTIVGSGLAGRNTMGSGLAVTKTGQVLNQEGNPVYGLYAIGPLLISKLLESVAVPELRVQVASLADLVLSEAATA